MPAAGWQLLGKLDLPVGPEMENSLGIRLTELLAPLKLQSDFLNRIWRSSQQAAGRVIAATDKVNQIRHIHMLIFVPQNPEGKGKTWGFFRIERQESPVEAPKLPDHAIELYLYMED